MVRNYFYVTYLLIFFFNISLAQVGIGTENSDVKAILHLESKDKGMLFTRMSEAERNGIESPPEGLTLYNTDKHCLEFWDGNKWFCSKNQEVKTPRALELRCKDASVEGSFVKGVASSGRIILKVDYNEEREDEIKLSDPVFVEGVQGLTVQPDPRMVNIKFGENILTYNVKGTPASAGTGVFKIPVLGDSCTVEVPVEETPEITPNYKAILNTNGKIEAEPKIITPGFEPVGAPVVKWEIADDENGTNKKSLESSKDSKLKALIPLNVKNKYLFYEMTVDYKKGNVEGTVTKSGLVGKIKPLPSGYIPSKSGEKIFTRTDEKFTGLRFNQDDPCRKKSVSDSLNVIGYDIKVRAGVLHRDSGDIHNKDGDRFFTAQNNFWWLDRKGSDHWGYDFKNDKNQTWSASDEHYGLCVVE